MSQVDFPHLDLLSETMSKLCQHSRQTLATRQDTSGEEKCTHEVGDLKAGWQGQANHLNSYISSCRLSYSEESTLHVAEIERDASQHRLTFVEKPSAPDPRPTNMPTTIRFHGDLLLSCLCRNLHLLISLPQTDPHGNLDLLGARGKRPCIHICPQLPQTLAHRSTSRHTAPAWWNLPRCPNLSAQPCLTDILVQVTDPGGEHGRLERKGKLAMAPGQLVTQHQTEENECLIFRSEEKLAPHLDTATSPTKKKCA